MKELLRTNDLVCLSWLTRCCRCRHREPRPRSSHQRVEGSIAAIPRRLMVADDGSSRPARCIPEAESAMRCPMTEPEPPPSPRTACSAGASGSASRERLSRRDRSGVPRRRGAGRTGRAGARCRLRRRRGDAVPRRARAGCRVIGIECSATSCGSPSATSTLNGMAGGSRSWSATCCGRRRGWRPASFDHVMANPPFLRRGRDARRPTPAKAAATIEGEADLADWVALR